jgi:hypothetical protein
LSQDAYDAKPKFELKTLPVNTATVAADVEKFVDSIATNIGTTISHNFL